MKRKVVSLSSSMERGLKMYALGASATGVGVLALAQPVEARIVYTPAHRTINGWLWLDINHDKVADFVILSGTGSSPGPNGYLKVCAASGVDTYGCATYMKTLRNRISGYPVGYASALPLGARISANAHFGWEAHTKMMSWACTPCRTWGQWSDKKSRYLGLSFVVHGKTHYGWARMNVGKHVRPAVLTGYAYETIPNKPIIAGQTHSEHEATLGRLAQGASGVSKGGKP